MTSPRWLFLIVALTVVGPAWGQAVPSREPSSTHIFPAGGQRGTTVRVRIGGECLPPDMAFHISGGGVSAPALLGPEAKPRYEPGVRRLPRDADGLAVYSREWNSEIKLAADAATGGRPWRVSGAFGGTQARPFLVGDLPEFVETEPNSRADRAERVSLPVVLNGQIAGERDEDFFTFAAKGGTVVVCDAMAARVGSPLDPALTVTDAAGRRLDAQEVRVGGDPVLAVRIPADGDYRLHVANLGFPGGPAFVYRVTVSTGPYAPFAFPAGGRIGETRSVDVYHMTGAGPLTAVKTHVTFPKESGPFRHNGVTPMTASEWPELASGTNHTAADATELAAPASVTGRFQTPNAEDWYRFTAKKGEAFSISCQAFPGDSAAAPILSLQDANGGQLTTANAVDSPADGIDLDWTAPADGLYRVRLRDLQHGTRGGPDFLYRLTVLPARPDFALRLDPNFVNVVAGGKTEVDLAVRRRGGFAGPINLTAAGLPEGVKVEPAVVPPGVTRMKVVFSAADAARPANAAVTLTGRATVGGKEIGRRATCSIPGGLLGEATTLALTVQHKPLFKITCNEAYQYAHRGTVYPYAVAIERLNGFDGPITLQLCERQVQDLDGIEVVESVVPKGAAESHALLYLPESMHTAAQHHSRPYVQGYARFTDQWGKTQTILAVCEKRCMIRTLPTVVKLRAAVKELEVRAGESTACRLTLDKTANFTGAADIELVGPPGLTAEKVRLGAGECEAVMQVRAGPAARPGDDLTATVRATGKLPSGATAITEATVRVRVK